MFQTNRNFLWIQWWQEWWYAEDHITFKAMVSSDWKLRVPTAWLSTSWGTWCAYDWNINVDWWTYTEYHWTWWTGINNTIVVAEWLTPNSEHTIDIRIFEDIENQYWRARAFWRRSSWIEDRLTELVVDSCYLWFAQSAESTWNYFRSYQYCWCSNLRNAYQEYIPVTCKDTWVHFRTYQYYWCNSLTVAWEESCPNSVLEIKDWFRQYQYANCRSLQQPASEVMPDTVTSIWQHFRWHMYENCVSIINWAHEELPQTLQTISHDFRCWQYKWCTNLTTCSDEVLPNTVTSIADWFRLEQYMNCYKLTKNAKEAMSSSLTYLAFHYRHDQYTNCTSITRLDVKSVPNSLSNHYYCRCDWLNNTWNTTNKMTIYCTWERVEYWDSRSSLDWNRVEIMYVPYDQVQWYRNNSFWGMVPDEKIVWY